MLDLSSLDVQYCTFSTQSVPLINDPQFHNAKLSSLINDINLCPILAGSAIKSATVLALIILPSIFGTVVFPSTQK